MKNLLIHTPEGFRDIYGGEMKRKRHVMSALHRVFEKYGYEDIETPAVEYFDVFGTDIGTTPSNELYKFFDRDGNTLVLRPDFTPSVARAVAMHFPAEKMPFRLCYQGNTYVNSAEYRLNLKESTQMGVELIGDGSVAADAEVLSMTVDLLKAAGLKEFQVSVGEVDFFKALAAESKLPEETLEKVRELISSKNFFGVGEVLDSVTIDPAYRRAFTELPQLFGGKEVLDRAEALAVNYGTKAAIGRLREIGDLLEKNGAADYVTYDFGLLSQFNYYTGIIFSAFTYNVGEPVAKGGRYDRLLAHFGQDAPSVGVGIQIDQLMNALQRQKITKEQSEEDRPSTSDKGE